MVSRGCDWADVGYYARQGSKRPPTAPGGWCNASSRQSKERFGVPRARPSETTSNATDFGRELREARNDDTETMLPTRDPAGGGCEDVRRPTAWCRTDCTCNAPIAARLVSSLTAMAPFHCPDAARWQHRRGSDDHWSRDTIACSKALARGSFRVATSDGSGSDVRPVCTGHEQAARRVSERQPRTWVDGLR
jgi:hypothetical protein